MTDNTARRAIAGLFALYCHSLAAAENIVEQQASLHTSSSFVENPGSRQLFASETESSNKILAREVVIIRPTDNWRLELNAYNILFGTSDKESGSQILTMGTDEGNRTSRMERHWHDSDRLDGYLAVDRLNVRWGMGAYDVTVGRFPINLATTAVFTPNDFFAPYRPHQFYREYKPGVDGIRIDRALGAESLVSVYGVAGFDKTPLLGHVVDEVEHNQFSHPESSVVGHFSTTIVGMETSVLGGKLGRYDMFGFGLQGEAKGFGVKAEAHQKRRRADSKTLNEAAIGADLRPTSSLLLQIEQFYHGSGYESPSDYVGIETDPEPPLYFFGRSYTALVGAYEVTPLLNLKGLLLSNLTDGSLLASTHLSYSLSENGDVAVSFLYPRGSKPVDRTAKSEFGTYPRILSFETRVHF